MKKIFCISLILAFNVSLAFAQDATGLYEDGPEFFKPQVEHNRQFPSQKNLRLRPRRSQAIWGIVFELMNADGTSTVLTDLNREALVKPASTMKLFTGWYAYKRSTRTDTYLSKMLRESVNDMADQTLKATGGKKALKKFYTERGVDMSATRFIQADGSGLSYDNKATCGVEIDLLKLMYSDKSYDNFKVLLAQPGVIGTLEKRLLNLEGKVFAKTGTLKSTASLTGFLETDKGVVVFCILSDYLSGGVKEARERIDKTVTDYSDFIDNI